MVAEGRPFFYMQRSAFWRGLFIKTYFMHKYYFLLVVSITMLAFGCKKPENTGSTNPCSHTVNSGILNVSSTTLTANVNQEIIFEMLFPVINGCGISSTVESSAVGNIVTLNVFTRYEGCICTQIYSENKKNYNFKSLVAGNFKLKFNKGNGTFIEKDVVIQ
jgi:hypothetical protein